MNIHDRAKSLLAVHSAAAPRAKKHATKLAAVALLATALVYAGEAKSQQPPNHAGQPAPSPPLTQAQIDNAAMLDKLLADRDYNALADKMLKPTDKSLITPTLDWAKARMLEGASQIVPLLYAHLLWGVASSNPQLASLKETAGLLVAYALLLNYADGVKCADQTAPAHHFDTIMARYTGELQYIGQMPNERRDSLYRIAVAMELKTAPLRQNDNYLCRFGLQEMQDNLAKHPAKEVPEPPGPAMHFGKTMAVQNDPDYQPKFLPREEWEPKQAAQRTQFATLLPTIVDRFKNVPAPQPPTP